MIKSISGLITACITLSVLYFLVYKPNSQEINQFFISEKTEKTESNSTKSKAKSKKKSSKSTSVKDGDIGKVVDSYKGVEIYYNGLVKNVSGRNTTSDGYNLGLKFQCVEFVKRFYYEVYNHKMPNSYGHAREFFKAGLGDGDINKDRGMFQFVNDSKAKPKADDLIVFGAAPFNKFGHVTVISKVANDYIEIAQQNPGTGNPSPAKYPLAQSSGKWHIDNQYIDGWLRMP